jgi:exo-1,4-beta-D-glucosaminidase
LHVQYSYDDASIVVVNHFNDARPGLTARATLYDLHATQLFTQSASLGAPADSSTRTSLALPALSASNPVYFLDLALEDASGTSVSSNFYWLTPTPDVMAPPDPSTEWYFIPIGTFADFSALSSLAQVTLKGTQSTATSGSHAVTTVTLENDSASLAFFTRAQVISGGAEVLPVIWSDNYVSIPPGAKKTLTATYDADLAAGGGVSVAVGGWNVSPLQL